MAIKKDTPPPFRLNIGNAAAQKVDPHDPRLARLIAGADDDGAGPAGGSFAASPGPLPEEATAPGPLGGLARMAARTEHPAAGPENPVGAGGAPLSVPVGPATAGRAGRSRAGGMTIATTPSHPVRRPRRASAATVRVSVSVEGPLPWDTLGEMADVQRNMNLRLTEADLVKLQWLAQCLPGTSIQKLCRDAIRSYVDVQIAGLLRE